ncbi:MAG: YidC/Oxa1 family membrane protein insertase, partial [Rhizobiaceae bacterium]
MDNQRNFFITIALSVVILTLWQVFYMNPRIEAQRHAAQVQAQQQHAAQKTAEANKKPASSSASSGSATPVAQQSGSTAIPGQTEESAAKAATTRAEDIAASKRIRIDTPSLSGSINLTGARLDDLVLKKYKETVAKNSPNIDLLNPQGLPKGYYAEIGFLGSKETGAVPGPDTVWSVEGNPVLTSKNPVTLTYTNAKGLTFKRTISVDDKYMFTFRDTVTNSSGTPVTLSNYGRATRFYKPEDHSSFYLHEGLIGMTGKEGLEEIKYSKIEKEKEVTPGKSTDGWL